MTKAKSVIVTNLSRMASAARDANLGAVLSDLIAGHNSIIGAIGVAAVGVTAGGSGYTSAPAVALTGGGGSGATGVAILNGTVVVAVVITNPGTGYTSAPTVGFSGGGGTGAAATAVLSPVSAVPLIKDFDKR